VWGESQGGHAALWTAQLARSYAPDLDLVGAAASAPATYLLDNLKNGADPNARTFLMAYALHSWSTHFGVPLNNVAGPQTRGVIRRLSENNCINFEAKPKLGTILGVVALRSNLRNVDLAKVEPWAGFGRANSPDPAQIRVPLMIAQNANDKIVAPAVTRRFAHDACTAGRRVEWLDLHGKGHETSARDAAAATLAWIDARFAGARAPSDCGKF
jgi:acetyl esterase/lipase